MKKNIFVCLLAVLLPCCASAYDFIVDGIYYKVVSEEDRLCKIVSYHEEDDPCSPREVIFIPAKVMNEGKEYTVAIIGEYAFHRSVQNGKHITLLDLLSAARREVHEPSGNLERKIHTVVGADCSRIAQARNLYPGPYNFATERTHRLRFIGTVFPGDGEQPDCGYRPCQNQASGGLYEQ